MAGTKAKAHGNRGAGTFAKPQDDREVDSDGEQDLERESPAQFGEDDREGEEVYGDGDGDAYDDDDDDKRGAAGGSKTPRERRKIEIKFIQNKARRHITFSKRKHGIMKKAWELSVLTGTQILLLVVSETGLVYTFTTPKLQPLVTQSEGKNLIQACLNAPDTPAEIEDGPSVRQEAPEVTGSTPPSSHPTPDHGLPPHHPQVQAAAQAQAQAAQAQAAHVQAQAQAAEVQAAQAAQATSASRQSGTQSPNSANQAAMQALQSAQAAQAMAVSGLPPHLQQLAGTGYKVMPPQYGGFQGFSPLPAAGIGGQFNAQIANQLQGQMGGQQLGQLDTATLLALKQQQEGLLSQSDYAHLFQQQQQQQQQHQHQQHQQHQHQQHQHQQPQQSPHASAGSQHLDPQQQPPTPSQPPQPQSQRFN